MTSPPSRAPLHQASNERGQVIFPAPMRVAPDLQFPQPPRGVEAHVVEKTNIEFTLIFTSQSIPVEKFGFAAGAEL